MNKRDRAIIKAAERFIRIHDGLDDTYFCKYCDAQWEGDDINSTDFHEDHCEFGNLKKAVQND